MLKLNLSSPHTNIAIWKNDSQSKYGVTGPKPSSGILPILVEALKITIRNGAAAASIILPVFLSYSVLGYGANLIAVPLSKDLFSYFTVQHGNPEDAFVIDETTRKSVRHYLMLALVEWFFSYVIMIIFLVTTISLASESHREEKVHTKDLFWRIGGKWKSLVITSFFMGLIFVSLMLLVLTSLGITFVVAEGFPLVALIVALVILGGFCYFYVGAVRVMSLVVSVLEEGSCGLKAIDRAGELMRGRRLKGCGLQFLVVLSWGIVYLASFYMTRKIGSPIQMSMLVMIPRTFLTCVAKFVAFVMFTVFYHECKKHHEEVGEVESDKGSYNPVASVEP